MQHKDIIHLQPFYDENTKTLDLSSQGVTDQDVIDYIVPFLHEHPDINSLNLNDNYIGNEGVTALLFIHTLTELNISKNKVWKISDVPSSCNLIKLDVSYNWIHGIDDLAKLAAIQTLQKLNISFNRISESEDNDKKKMVKNAISMLSKSCLVDLNASNNTIKSGYVFTALATIPTLTELDVSNNLISLNDIDKNELRQALKNSQIIKLNMSRNAISAEGFRSIVSVIPTLTELGASGIWLFKPVHMEALAINRQLTKLDFSYNRHIKWLEHGVGWMMCGLVVAFPNLEELNCSSAISNFHEEEKLANLASLRKLTVDKLDYKMIITLFHNPCFEELNIHVNSISSSLAKEILASDLPPIKKFNFLKHMFHQLLQAEKNGKKPQRAIASFITPELAIDLLNLAVPVNEKINFLRDVIYSSSVNLITSELINEISNSDLPPHEKINLLRQIRHKINIAEEEGEKINISEEEKKDLKEKAGTIPSLFDLTKSHLLQSTPELKECDLLVIEVADIKEYTDSLTDIIAAAKEKKLPMIVFIRSHIIYYIYGDKNNDGNWDLMRITDISSLHLLPLFDINKKSRQDSTANTLTLIKRNELSPVLIKQLALYHSNLSPMEARVVVEQNPNTAPYYDKWHERISELKKFKLDSSEKIEDFVKLASKWADELIKDKKEVEGKTEEIIISNEKKDLLRFLGIVYERYLTPKWDEAKKLIDKEKAAQKVSTIFHAAAEYQQKIKEKWIMDEVDQISLKETTEAITELLIPLATFQDNKIDLLNLEDKLEPDFYYDALQSIETIIKLINGKKEVLEIHLSALTEMGRKVNEMKGIWVSYLETIKNKHTEGAEINELKESFRKYSTDITQLEQDLNTLHELKNQIDLFDPYLYEEVTLFLKGTVQTIRSKIAEIIKIENETAKEIVVEWNRRGTVAIAYLRSDSKMTEEEEIVFLRTVEENILFLRRASSLEEEFANDKKIIGELSCHETIKAEAIAQLDHVHSYQIEPVVNEIKKKVSQAIDKINDGLDEDIQQLEGLDCQLNTLMGQMLLRFDGNILENNGDVDTLDQGFFKSIEDLIKNRAQLEQGISAKEEQLSQLLAQCKGIGLDSAKLTSAQQTVLEQNTRLSALNLAYQYTVNTFDNNKKMAAKIREMQAVYDETKKRLTQAQTVLKQSDQHLRSKITAANRIATQGINPVYFHKHKFVYAYEDQLTYLQQCERKLKETADASSQILLALIAEEEVIEKTNLKSAINHINFFQYSNLRVNLNASKSTIEEVDKQILEMKNKIHAKADDIHVFQNTLNKKLNEVSEKIINWQGKLDDFEKLKMSLVASKPFKALREYAKGSAKWMQINAYLNDIKSAKTKSELIRAVKANHKDVILKSYYGKEKKLEREEYYFEHTMRENTGCGFYGLFHGRGKSTTDAYAIQLQDVLDKLLDSSISRHAPIVKRQNRMGG